MRILLTGGTGLIGPKVLQRLLDRGHRVRVLALPETVHDVPAQDRVEVVAGSLTELAALARAVQNVELIFHLAARVLGASAEDLVRINVRGTENLLNATVGSKVRRFVFTSSVAAYDSAPLPHMWPITEDSPLRAHGNPALHNYGQSKIDGERLVLRAHREHGLEYVILRPPAVYGPRVPWVEELLARVAQHPWRAFSPAAQGFNMQWMHVEDVAEAIVLAGTHPAAANQIFTVAGSEVFRQTEILAALRPAGPAGGNGFGRWRPRRQIDDQGVLKYDITKARLLLGFTPRIRLADGLKEIVADLDRRGVGVGGRPTAGGAGFAAAADRPEVAR